MVVTGINEKTNRKSHIQELNAIRGSARRLFILIVLVRIIRHPYRAVRNPTIPRALGRRRLRRVRPIVRVGRRHSEHQAKRVLAVQIKPKQPLLPNKPKRLVQRQRRVVVVFGFENDLRSRTKNQSRSKNRTVRETHLFDAVFLHRCE